MRSSWWQRFTRAIGLGQPTTTPSFKSVVINFPRAFQAHDLALIRPLGRTKDDGKMIKALSPQGKVESHKGTVRHSDIIGKRPRDLVYSTTGTAYRLHDVSLSDYVRLSRRLVTPIYPADANVIVSLLDIHVERPPIGSSSDGRYEILEAGTGHGALTLHLSRALHAGNALRGPDQDEAEWKAERSAVLHTVEISDKYSIHARKIVSGFRQGMYAGNVDFHVGSVSDFVQAEVARRQHRNPFLMHAFLDLPGTEDHLETVSSVLHPDGKLVIFAPSITQVIACFQKARDERLPLILDKVLELGTNGSSGGREWDVRAVIPREKAKARQTKAEIIVEKSEDAALEGSAGKDEGSESSTSDVESATDSEDWKMVCRPKVGERVVGGGFLAVFVKKGESG